MSVIKKNDLNKISKNKNSLKDYLSLIRAYSIVDLLLILFLARTLSIGNIDFSYKDILFGVLYILLWLYLTLDLEAQHKHPYRAQISHKFPYTLLIIATIISAYYSITSVLFIALIWVSTNLYIRKESSNIVSHTSFLTRGLYEASIFFYGISLYVGISGINLTNILIGLVIFLLYSSRNLVADVRDVAFDKNTFTVRYGSKNSYLVSLATIVLAAFILYYLYSSFLVTLPILVYAIALLFYDNGFSLHRSAIKLTSFTSANIILYILFSEPILLVLSNTLFLVVLSDFLFYEATPRKSNPKQKVNTEVSFLLFRDNRK